MKTIAKIVLAYAASVALIAWWIHKHPPDEIDIRLAIAEEDLKRLVLVQ